MNWQPIETAPKDGTEVIGAHYHDWSETYPPTVYGPWTMAFIRNEWRPSWDEMNVIESESDFGTEYKTLDCQPTHWMPLPSPPNSEDAGK